MLDPWRLRLLSLLEGLGTVRAVAEAARLSPSTVSQQLAVLEREAGARLLERAGRRLRLTPAGTALVRHARVILDQMDAARAEAVSIDSELDGGEPAGRVRVGAFTSAVNTFVIAAVRSLRRRHPRLRVDIWELDPLDSLPALRRGDCDIAVTADFIGGARPSPPGGDVTHTALTDDAIVLVTAAALTPATPPPPAPTAAASTPAAPTPAAQQNSVAQQNSAAPQNSAGTAAGGTVDLADYRDSVWSAELPGTWTYDLIARACRRAGFEPDLGGVFASYAPLLAHVEAGLSVTLLPELAVDPRYRVRSHPLREPLVRHVTAAVRTSSAARPAVAAVVRELRTTATQGWQRRAGTQAGNARPQPPGGSG